MNDNKLHTIICGSLDKDVDALSAELRSKLTRVRVSSLERRSTFSFWKVKSKAITLLASLAVVAVSSYVVLQTPSTTVDHVDMVASSESLQQNLIEDEPIFLDDVDTDVGDEFFLTEEDLDFFDNLDLYQWLDAEFKLS